MTIAIDVSRLVHSARVELFVLDATALGAPSLLRYANEVNELGLPITWQGQQYTPIAIQAEGFDKRSDGPFPRPTLRVGNVLGSLTPLVRQYGRLKGAKLTRKVTLAKYLDGVNFAAGNADADPLMGYPDELWLIDRTSQRNKLTIEWELANPLDVSGVQLPSRAVRGNHCPWAYRGADCGYAGTAKFTLDGTSTTDPAQDRCGKRLSDCKLRFGTAELPYGGFPGVGIVRTV